ncbi:MAG: sodium-dependent transporter [FCB group bacterium]|nr:sodium-dependent transporter [FCB group bacterium]
MSEKRERWDSRTAFLFAAVGSAIGLGNVWRFPYVAYENGGGAFLIPYFVALFTAGIPLVILELGLGQRNQGSAPLALFSVNKKFEWVGWWALGVCTVIVLYYSAIMAWCWNYIVFSFNQAWGADANEFFYSQFLNLSDGPGQLGAISFPVVITLAITWFVIYWIISKGVGRVGKVVMITVPLPVILMVILFIRGITLPGAIDGLAYYLTPDFTKLLDPNIWLAAYGQVFFSVGLGWGILIAYASYREKNAEIVNSSFMLALSDCGFSFFAGMAVFSILGYLAVITGKPVSDVATAGFGLAFVAYPTAISQLPFLQVAFGVIFFLMLLTLGIDSAFSMVEAVVSGFIDKWKFSKKKASAVFCLFGFLLGIVFTTQGGFYWLDILDHWAGHYGLAAVGLMECVIIGWFINTESFRQEVNSISEFPIGRWWIWAVKYITPAILGLSIILDLFKEFSAPYGDYPLWTLITGGWFQVIALIALSMILTRMKWKKTG